MQVAVSKRVASAALVTLGSVLHIRCLQQHAGGGKTMGLPHLSIRDDNQVAAGRLELLRQPGTHCRTRSRLRALNICIDLASNQEFFHGTSKLAGAAKLSGKGR